MRGALCLLLAGCLAPRVVLAQSRADQLPATSPDVVPPASPLPGNGLNNVPSRPDLAAIHRVTPPEKEPVPTIVTAGPVVDTLSRHFVLGFAATYGRAFGRLDSRTSSTENMGAAESLMADIGYGLSPHFALALQGALGGAGNTSTCSDCSARFWLVRPWLRYHLVQGTRFDPWLGVGAGLRGLTLKGRPGSDSYLGVDLVSLAVGGDWYATSQIGFGPLLSLEVTRYLRGPDGTSARNSTTLLTGIRAVLDLPGK